MNDIMKSKKDWTGNSKAIYSCHGASNHSDTEREENDFYETPKIATEMLCELETFSKDILEPACGTGDISKVLEEQRYTPCFDGYGIYVADSSIYYEWKVYETELRK